MVVKREAPSSPTASEYGSPPSPAPSDDTKPTPKRTKPSPKKKTSSSTPTKPRAEDVITPAMKQTMMVGAMDLAYKQLPFNEYAKEVSLVNPCKLWLTTVWHICE
jgi:hypothetical protein